jgi:hypothetical protein
VRLPRELNDNPLRTNGTEAAAAGEGVVATATLQHLDV